MAQIECAHCGTRWKLGESATNRCPTCGWVIEVYFNGEDANRAAAIYNSQEPALPEPSGVRPLIGLNGYAVAFPDQNRLAAVADQLLELGL